MGFFHALLNVLALTPLLERFEAEHGTLTSVALFIGRKFWCFAVASSDHTNAWFQSALSTFPAGLYILVEKVLLHRNTPVVGARSVIF